MDAGSVSRPVFVAPQQSEANRPQNTDTVTTELPTDQAVAATTESESTRRAQDNARESRERPPAELFQRLERDIKLDDESGEFLVQGVHAPTGDVVWQYPSEAMMKVSAYAREQTAPTDATDVASKVEKSA